MQPVSESSYNSSVARRLDWKWTENPWIASSNPTAGSIRCQQSQFVLLKKKSIGWQIVCWTDIQGIVGSNSTGGIAFKKQCFCHGSLWCQRWYFCQHCLILYCLWKIRLLAIRHQTSVILNEKASILEEYFKHNFENKFFCWQRFEGNCMYFFDFLCQVMIQRHNRHMSFSIYICVLAIADTVTLSIGQFLAHFKVNKVSNKLVCFTSLH